MNCTSCGFAPPSKPAMSAWKMLFTPAKPRNQNWNPNHKLRAMTGHTMNTDSAVMGLYNLLSKIQPHPHAFGAFRAEMRLKDSVKFIGGDPRACVANADFD